VEQVDFYEGYDLVLLIDTLEHLPQDQGHSLLHSLLSRNQYVLVSTPNSPYPQGAVHGNELETHRSEWRAADFAAYRATLIFEGLCHIYLIQGATWL
jgi:2-polyprenyl-3-methyl-5-hydroxy-6-metoxy-1,4-benzoquinol methylase